MELFRLLSTTLHVFGLNRLASLVEILSYRQPDMESYYELTEGKTNTTLYTYSNEALPITYNSQSRR